MKRSYYIALMMVSFMQAISFQTRANDIVYPWRACPVIVPVGKTINILYDNRVGMQVDSVILEGPYNRVVLKIDTVKTGWFEYDNYTKAGVSNILRVTIPQGTPEELYDLVVKCGRETNVSRRSVKVLKSYRDPYRFIHISDPHISRLWIGYAKELQLLDKFTKVANIIAPEFVMVTGDLIHDYTRFDADSLEWGGVVRSGYDNPPLAEEKFKNYFEGANGFSGVYGFNAPVFSTAGNHDFYGPDKTGDNYAKASQWNRLMGKRVYGFSYLNTRILVADNFLGDSLIDDDTSNKYQVLPKPQQIVLDSFLNSAGKGKIRIMAQHSHRHLDTAFYNRNKINILLNGHSHTPHEERVGTTPTLSIRSGAVSRSGEIANWEKILGFFRIFTINGDGFQYSKPLRFCKNPTAPYDSLVLNLTLDFKKDNTGKSISNEAVIVNRFDTDLPGCNVRFIMPKNKKGYKVSGGGIYQTIDGTHVLVVDVRTDVKANSSKVISIE